MLRTFLPAILLAPLAVAPAFAATIVVQKNRAFRPAEVTVNRGDTVTFTNADSYIHQVYVQDLFDSTEKSPGENLNETYPRSATDQERSHKHPNKMKTV